MALATATPTAMIAPMKLWMLSVVPVSISASTTPSSAAGIGGEHDDGEAHALEVGDEQEEDGDDGDEQAGLQTVLQFLHRRHLAAQRDVHTGGRGIVGDDFLDLLRDAAERLVVQVRGDRDGARHVVAVVLAERAAFADLGDVAQRHGAVRGALVMGRLRRSSRPFIRVCGTCT